MACGDREIVPLEMRPAEGKLGSDEWRAHREAVGLGVLDRLCGQLGPAAQTAASRLEQRQLAQRARCDRAKTRAARQLDRRPEQRVRLGQLATRGLGRAQMRERAGALRGGARRRVETAAARCLGELGGHALEPLVVAVQAGERGLELEPENPLAALRS